MGGRRYGGGGRVAEEIVYGEDEVTTGASNDLQQVRNIARRMVAQWGFANDAMGAAPVKVKCALSRPACVV